MRAKRDVKRSPHRTLRREGGQAGFRLLSGVAGASLLGAALLAAGAGVANQFAPPRVAVVDRQEVFQEYEKTKESREQISSRMKELQDQLSDLEKQYKALEQDLLKLDEASPLYFEKNLEKKSLELQVEQLQSSKVKSVQKDRLQMIKEIEEEIGEEVRAYAEANDLDMVLERQLAVPDARGIGFQWPIVHYQKPEYDITREIIDLLNSKYKRKG